MRIRSQIHESVCILGRLTVLPFVSSACQALTNALPRNLYIRIFQLAVYRLSYKSTALCAQNNKTIMHDTPVHLKSQIQESRLEVTVATIRVAARDHGIKDNEYWYLELLFTNPDDEGRGESLSSPA